MPRVVESETIEHTFAWSLLLEPGQRVPLFTDGWRESIWWPPRCVDMKLTKLDVSFLATMQIAGIGASRADVAIDVVIGCARALITSGPWLTDPRTSMLSRPITLPVRQNLQVYASPLPGGGVAVQSGPAHIWIRCAFKIH